jgi:signal transduction histidine kinase
MATGNVLVCAPTGSDAAVLLQSLRGDGILGYPFSSIEELSKALDDTSEVVIIAEEALIPHGVERLFACLKNQPAWSDITVILLTHGGTGNTQIGSSLVHFFGKHGNVNMLERPLNLNALSSAVRSAMRARARQYEVRELLLQREFNERILQDAREELERRVLQRTLEITKANADLRREISERLSAESALRQLSQNIVRLQDEERRRIARELHDSAGQYLSAVTLTLGQLARRLSTTDDRNKELINEALQLVGDCITEVRSISYLLHPPVLDDFGLVAALRWYVEGFAQRSGIQVRLELSETLPRFSGEVETTLFRIVQEALTNVHRHSGGKNACVEVHANDEQIDMTITDDGHGMAEDLLRNVDRGQGGLGLMDMYERAKKLGGNIHIDSNQQGTTIHTHVPHNRASGAAAATT